MRLSVPFKLSHWLSRCRRRLIPHHLHLPLLLLEVSLLKEHRLVLLVLLMNVVPRWKAG